jgi:hypothetical protein
VVLVVVMEATAQVALLEVRVARPYLLVQAVEVVVVQAQATEKMVGKLVRTSLEVVVQEARQVHQTVQTGTFCVAVEVDTGRTLVVLLATEATEALVQAVVVEERQEVEATQVQVATVVQG